MCTLLLEVPDIILLVIVIIWNVLLKQTKNIHTITNIFMIYQVLNKIINDNINDSEKIKKICKKIIIINQFL
jgi:anionic cell wall polymer biosynthesis LytR-Cps2A-Psr (LCP) family protein